MFLSLTKKPIKVIFEKLKYNKEDLFSNTPVFDYPIINFGNKKEITWNKITRKIMSPFREFSKIKNYFEQNHGEEEIKQA